MQDDIVDAGGVHEKFMQDLQRMDSDFREIR